MMYYEVFSNGRERLIPWSDASTPEEARNHPYEEDEFVRFGFVGSEIMSTEDLLSFVAVPEDDPEECAVLLWAAAADIGFESHVAGNEARRVMKAVLERRHGEVVPALRDELRELGVPETKPWTELDSYLIFHNEDFKEPNDLLKSE